MKRKIAKPFRGSNRKLARNIRKKEYDITASRVRRVFTKTTEVMRLTCLKEQCKRIRKTLSTVETIKEKADLFRAELRKLEKTSEHVEMNIAIAKQEVSEATEHVITKTRQQEKQLLETLEETSRKRRGRVKSAKQELESQLEQLWISYKTKTN